MAEYLPSCVNYAEPLAVLPANAQNYLYASVPCNGSSFTAGSIIQVDLGSRGFLDPAYLIHEAALSRRAGQVRFF